MLATLLLVLSGYICQVVLGNTRVGFRLEKILKRVGDVSRRLERAMDRFWQHRRLRWLLTDLKHIVGRTRGVRRARKKAHLQLMEAIMSQSE